MATKPKYTRGIRPFSFSLSNFSLSPQQQRPGIDEADSFIIAKSSFIIFSMDYSAALE